MSLFLSVRSVAPYYRPFLPQPAVVIMLTDGGPLVSMNGIAETVNWPPWTLQHEPFRWDQRLFCVALRMGAIQQVRSPPVNGLGGYVFSDLALLETIVGHERYYTPFHDSVNAFIPSPPRPTKRPVGKRTFPKH